MLEFIGCGSALNTRLGNNSACIRSKDELLLIDCGSATFARMQQFGLFEKSTKIKILMTHTHPDHVGSLGDLIFFGHYIIRQNVEVLTPEPKYLMELLGYMGVDENDFTLTPLAGVYDLKLGDLNISIETVPVTHVKSMNSFGYIIKNTGKTFYYSGDSNNINADILQRFKNNEINFIYQDTCDYHFASNPHLSLKNLCSLIEPEYRSRVYCMHFDEDFDVEKAKNLGFMCVANAFE